MGTALSNEQRGTTVEVMIKIMDAAGLPLTVHGKVLPRHLAENLMTFVP